jgi:hypothetical protein
MFRLGGSYNLELLKDWLFPISLWKEQVLLGQLNVNFQWVFELLMSAFQPNSSHFSPFGIKGLFCLFLLPFYIIYTISPLWSPFCPSDSGFGLRR